MDAGLCRKRTRTEEIPHAHVLWPRCQVSQVGQDFLKFPLFSSVLEEDPVTWGVGQ